MSSHGTASIGSWVEFASSVFRQLPRPEEMDETTCEGWSKNQAALKKTLAGALLRPTKVAVSAKPKIVKALPDIDWLKSYESLGMKAEYEEAMETLPKWSDPNLWIVPVVASKDRKKVVTRNMVIVAMRKSGVKVWTYADDLDASIVSNDRDPANSSYLIGFRRTIEADEENKNLSANVLASRGHKGTTCLERELLGHGYYLATRQHLDVKCVTLCPGSRYRNGHVPSVRFYRDDDEVCVGRYFPGDRDDNLRSRSAVPPPVALQLA